MWVRVPSSAPKEKGTERCLFLLVPVAAGTSASLHLWQEPAVPPHAPSLFVIPYSLQSKRTAPATGRGLEPNGAPGFFLCPKSALPFQPIRTFPDQRRHPKECLLLVCTTGFPKTALPESVPQSGTPQLFTLLYSLFTRPAPAFPPRFPGRPENRPPQGGGGSVPRQQCGTAKRPFPRTAPPAGHRLILNPCRRAAHRNSSLFSILSSLAQPRPSPPTSRERQRAALSRGGGSVPRQQCGTAKRPFPRTVSPAGHRLILNPCRRAAHRNSSLFSILYSLSQPCPFFPPERTAKQKYILFFGHLTHNSARYNIGLNLIMDGKEYGKTGSA